MKILIVSDIHLGKRFCQRKFDYLYQLFSSVDKIVLNGDFWDSALISFEDFLQSLWSDLFPVLLSKNTTYIVGNHDFVEKLNQNVNAFSVEVLDKISLYIGDDVLNIEHGHELVLGLEKFGKLLPSRVYEKIRSCSVYVVNTIENLGIRLFGSGFCKIMIYRLLDHRNLRLEMRKNGLLNDGRKYIFGHLHIDVAKKDNYMITAGINHGVASYVLINGEDIKFIREKY